MSAPEPFIGPHTAQAFAAIEAIMSGHWDRYLIRINTAIRERMRTTAWTQHVVTGGGLPVESEFPTPGGPDSGPDVPTASTA